MHFPLGKSQMVIKLTFSLFLQNKLFKETTLRGNEPLANKTTIGVGGLARWYAEPAHSEDLRLLVETVIFLIFPGQ